jgi:hypothetical protein
MKRECDERRGRNYSDEQSATAEQYQFPPSKHRRDIMTYRFPFDD